MKQISAVDQSFLLKKMCVVILSNKLKFIALFDASEIFASNATNANFTNMCNNSIIGAVFPKVNLTCLNIFVTELQINF